MRTVLLIFTFFLFQCASRADPFQTKVLHHHIGLDRAQFSNQSILFLPAINGSTFDSSGVLSADSQARLLQTLRDDQKVCTAKSFERAYLKHHGSNGEGLARFYEDIISNDILALQTSDSVWQHMACRYLLTTRVAYGARVRTFEGTLLRTVRVEAELWDVESIEVVWRAQSKGLERDARTPDSQFLKEAILRIFEQLPAYRPSLNEKDW